jgi:hypothetical protein
LENTSAESLAERAARALPGIAALAGTSAGRFDRAGRRPGALFRIVVERLADLFEPHLCRVTPSFFPK